MDFYELLLNTKLPIVFLSYSKIRYIRFFTIFQDLKFLYDVIPSRNYPHPLVCARQLEKSKLMDVFVELAYCQIQALIYYILMTLCEKNWIFLLIPNLQQVQLTWLMIDGRIYPELFIFLYKSESTRRIQRLEFQIFLILIQSSVSYGYEL